VSRLLAALEGPRLWCLAFLALCAPVCIALALIVPPGEVADEGSHLARAAALLHGEFVGHRENVRYADGSTHVAAGVRIDPAWAQVARTRPPDFKGTLHAIDGEPDAQGRIFLAVYTVGTYPPFPYMPAAAGLAAGQVLGLAPEACAYLGRLANATAYGVLALLALALATRGRAAFFALLALPMSLSLAASFNQDALIIALAALAAALLTPRPFAGPGARWRFAGAVLCIAVAVLAKPPYAGLAAMLLLPLPQGGGLARQWLRRLAVAVLAVLPAALWTAAATATVATPVPRFAYEAGPLWTGPRPATFTATDPAAQAKILMEKPALLATLPGHFLGSIKHLIVLAKGAVGILGWLDRPLPGFLYAVWGIALLGLLLGLRGPPPPWADRLLLPAAALASLWLILLSQYVTWSGVGDTRIDGPQGRYLLPLAPMLILAFARRRPAEARRWPALLPIGAAALDLVALPLSALAMTVPA
jgi:uncharacterized membrane protein